MQTGRDKAVTLVEMLGGETMHLACPPTAGGARTPALHPGSSPGHGVCGAVHLHGTPLLKGGTREDGWRLVPLECVCQYWRCRCRCRCRNAFPLANVPLQALEVRLVRREGGARAARLVLLRFAAQKDADAFFLQHNDRPVCCVRGALDTHESRSDSATGNGPDLGGLAVLRTLICGAQRS